MFGCAHKRGFTLIELLVAIGVIAVLTGILVPSLGLARAMAKRTVCQSHFHSAALAFRVYLDDNNHFMPPAARLPSAGGSVKCNLAMGMNVCGMPSDTATVAGAGTRPSCPYAVG